MFFAKRFRLPVRCRIFLLLFTLALMAAHGSWAERAKKTSAAPELAGSPPPSRYFSAATEEAYSSYQMRGDGDLWPTCWADDDNLYTANGDGSAFTGTTVRPDLVVSRIKGMPPNLNGTVLTANVGTNWSGPGFNRKPTGMLCIHSTLYLAFQNLDKVGFNSAPAASIAKSTDHGLTWHWDATAPMFGGPGNEPLFTTVFFLDFGKNSVHAIDKYVYAYGLDHNWRSQQALYLGRVPASRIQTRSAWEFYAGRNGDGAPVWSADIREKQPVLLDTRVVTPADGGPKCPATDSVIAQGGVVYDKPLKRYLFSSWSCSTHEIYEATSPWGPWKHVFSHSFGATLTTYNRGQYGTSVPSKFISADGRKLLLQSNVCCSGDSYTFSLRAVELQLSPMGERDDRERSPGREALRRLWPSSWMGLKRSTASRGMATTAGVTPPAS